MGIWSDYFVAHSAAAFEALLHDSPLHVPPVRVRRAAAALSLKVTERCGAAPILFDLNPDSRLHLNLLVQVKLFFWVLICRLD